MGVVLGWGQVSEAEPMGTGFTYQGRLHDTGYPADGLYDFVFKIYDANTDGNQLSSAIEVNDCNVRDGHFWVKLDFGSDVFDGEARWLETTVAHGDGSDPCTLSPRQELTAVPYALQTRGMFVDNAGNVHIRTTSPTTKLEVSDGPVLFRLDELPDGFTVQALDTTIFRVDTDAYESYFESGNVGIGTTNPGAKLEVNGQVKITGGTPGAGKVLTSDADGLASWQTGGAGSDSDWMVAGQNMYSIPDGNVGIGTIAPEGKLHVVDDVYRGHAVKSETSAVGGKGVYGYASGTSGTNYGVYGRTESTDGYAGYFAGRGYFADNVGVGTDSPASKLHVHKSGAAQLRLSSDASEYADFYKGSDGLAISVNGSEKVRLSDNGNVGIGTATSPEAKLDVATPASGPALTVGRKLFSPSIAPRSDAEGGWLIIDSNPPGSVGLNYYVDANVILAEGGGSVGIGTKDPCLAKLHVITSDVNEGAKGVVGHATYDEDAYQCGGYFQADAWRGCGVRGYASSTSTYFRNNFGGIFEAEGIDGCGATGLAYGGRGRGLHGEAMGSWGVGVVGKGGQCDFIAAGPEGHYCLESSIRWKTDIRPIDDPLGKVLALRGVYFNWDEEHGGGHDVGMVAEEVGEIVPEAVAYELNGVDAFAMDYTKLTPLLVEAVKALKTEADQRERQHAEKDAIIERLQEENRMLFKRVAAIEEMVGTTNPAR